jgi:hypothetical protein
MTEEQLNIANNTLQDLKEAKALYRDLKNLLNSTNLFVRISDLHSKENTFLKDEERAFMNELLEYRRLKVIALEREFAAL